MGRLVQYAEHPGCEFFVLHIQTKEIVGGPYASEKSANTATGGLSKTRDRRFLRVVPKRIEG